MNKIVIIGVYYGILPPWIPYWLKSCETNNNVDFLLITDNKIEDIPSNVKIINISMGELKNSIENKLGFDISLIKPYKLCDFKPIYGLIFEDYINDYEYWGHCDFDMIFGDIEYMCTQNNLNHYDKFLQWGHLSLYKNCLKINQAYKLGGSNCGNYKEVFSSSDNYAFDEVNGIYQIFKKNNFSVFEKRIFAEIKTFHQRFRLKMRDKNYYYQIFYFENGKIFRAYIKNRKMYVDEYIYIHFRRNLKVESTINSYKQIDNCFYITPTGFYSKNPGVPTKEEIKKYNPNPGYIKECFETLKFCIKNYNKILRKIFRG